MATTETTRRSYGSRLKSSLGGIGTGLIMFFVGTCVLWCNEGRTKHTADLLEEVAEQVEPVESIDKVNPDYEGKLIHATGRVTTTDSLVDKKTGVGVTAVKMHREVQYYQWVEHSESTTEDKFGGSEETTTTYTYERDWVGSPVNSDQFKETGKDNHALRTDLKDEDYQAENVKIGAYVLPQFLASQMSNSYPLDVNLSADMLEALDEQTTMAATGLTRDEFKRKLNADAAAADTTATADSTAAKKAERYYYVHVTDNVIYLGRNEAKPEIGDIRITYTYAPQGDASIIAKVHGNTFEKYRNKSKQTYASLSTGQRSWEDMIDGAESGNNLMKWLLRLVGTIIVISGLKTMFSILETLLKVVPFLANIVGWGVGTICTIVGIVWSLIVIAIAWVFVRPVVGILILVVAIAILLFATQKGKALLEKSKEKAASMQTKE